MNMYTHIYTFIEICIYAYIYLANYPGPRAATTPSLSTRCSHCIYIYIYVKYI